MTPEPGAAEKKAAEAKPTSHAANPVTTRHGIVVLDFGGQYTQLIARRIREQQVFSAVLPCTASLEEIRALEPAGIILSGGPSSVYDVDAPVCDPKVLELGVPVLGICYGMQWLAHTLGGKVVRADRREYGPAAARLRETGQSLSRTSRTSESLEQPRRSRHRRSRGIRHHRPHGQRHCCRRRRRAKILWRRVPSGSKSHRARHGNPAEFRLRDLRAQRKTGTAPASSPPRSKPSAQQAEGARAICALSGGVDSAVAAALVHRAIGDRLTNVFVDTGLLRQNEFHDTLELLRDRLGLHVIGVDASDRFLARLEGVTDPEEKRKRIGAEFIAVFAEEAAQARCTGQPPACR